VVRQTDRPAPANTSFYAPVGLETSTAPVENPCPYCGVPTTLTQKRCTQCRGDLMVRAAPPEQRSLPLLLLGGMWGLGGFLWLAVAALQLALLIMRDRVLGLGGQLLPGIVISLLVGLLFFFLANRLFRRERWAYFANMLLIALNAILAFGVVAAARLFLAFTNGLPEQPPFIASASTVVNVLLIVIVLGFVLTPIVLTILSYRDFFGPMVRFAPTFEDADHMAHYNNGIAYRDRGMWYMAAREWEAAARKKPREANYLHALGLAYARLKRFEHARATLDQALRAAPDHPKIKESRALVDRMAAQAAK
jgi:tetratricopeptide (TPR) repeat protein